MTAHKDRKRLVRARARRTGESYTAALRQLRSAEAWSDVAVDDPRIPPEGRPALRRYRELFDDQLPGRIGGLYLVGAVALGEFNAHHDRLDFIAVSDTRLSEADRAACGFIHHAVQTEFSSPALDGLYVTWEQLRAFPPRDSRTVMAWSDGRLAPADIAGYPGSKVNPVTWTILARHGITLHGPGVTEIGVHHDRAELVAWTLRNLDTYWRRTARTARHMPKQAAAAFDARGIVWMILGPPRLHYTIATGCITTKDAAGEYALTSLPDRWHGLVRDALAIHRADTLAFEAAADDALPATIADFIDFVISDAHRLADR